MNYNRLRTIINLEITDANIIVFPPLFEESLELADISLNLKFANGDSVILFTSENLWTQEFKFEEVEPNFNFYEFTNRMKFWMTDIEAEDQILKNEVYNLKHSEEFDNIIGFRVRKIELINIGDELNPYGIKLTLSNHEEVFSLAGHDGNNIITSNFLADKDPLECHSFVGESHLVDIA